MIRGTILTVTCCSILSFCQTSQPLSMERDEVLKVEGGSCIPCRKT